MNPKPTGRVLRGIALDLRLDLGARDGAIPPRASGDEGASNDGAIAIDEHAFFPGLLEPHGHGFIGGTAGIAIVIARGDEQAGAGGDAIEILFDHDDLEIDIEGRSEIEQIAADGHKIVLRRASHDPIELPECVMQIGDEEQLHSDVGRPRGIAEARREGQAPMCEMPVRRVRLGVRL